MTTTPATLSECLDGDTPIVVRAIDVERDRNELWIATGGGSSPYRRMLALIRDQGRPIGWVSLPVREDGYVDLAQLPSRRRHERDGRQPAQGDDATEDCLSPQGHAAADCLLSVVICTCADSESTTQCVESILASDAGKLEIIVVENRPGRSRVQEALVTRFGRDEPIRYIEEPRSGLSSARNAGLRAARGELVAFTDDDVIVDSGWISALRMTFARESVDCVCGMIAPLEFQSPAQVLVERFASYGKGFEQRVYSLAAPPADEPLFPYAAGHFASGANMAFRAGVLRQLGGFDRFLGTGTPARGCEDLDICIRLLQAGRQLAYQPSAIIWHRHPDTAAGLRRRVFDYGAALGAMLTKHLIAGSARREIIRRAPQGARYFVSSQSRKNAARDAGFPKGLKRLELAGILYGPFAYVSSRMRTR